MIYRLGVTETKTTLYDFDVEADSEDEARQKVLAWPRGEGVEKRRECITYRNAMMHPMNLINEAMGGDRKYVG